MPSYDPAGTLPALLPAHMPVYSIRCASHLCCQNTACIQIQDSKTCILTSVCCTAALAESFENLHLNPGGRDYHSPQQQYREWPANPGWNDRQASLWPNCLLSSRMSGWGQVSGATPAKPDELYRPEDSYKFLRRTPYQACLCAQQHKYTCLPACRQITRPSTSPGLTKAQVLLASLQGPSSGRREQASGQSSDTRRRHAEKSSGRGQHRGRDTKQRQHAQAVRRTVYICDIDPQAGSLKSLTIW